MSWPHTWSWRLDTALYKIFVDYVDRWRMKMEVTQSIIIVEYMLCFYKIIGTFLSSPIMDN